VAWKKEEKVTEEGGFSMRERQRRPIPLEIEGGLHWYTIRTKYRREASVEQKLKQLNIEVFLPWIRSRRRIGSRYQWALEPLFPLYLFCRLDLALSGKTARYTPGVKDFVKFGNRIAEVAADVIQTVRDRCPNGVAQIQPRIYRVSEPIMIKEGPFAGLGAIFEREINGSQRVAVLLEFLGRQTRVVLSSEMIGRA
jgi:transcriptional antiterminator RfaH